MNPKVEEFICKMKEEQEQYEKRKRDRHLISLGLVDENKTIEFIEYSKTRTEEHRYIDPQNNLFYKKEILPAPIEVSDEEYIEILRYAPLSKSSNQSIIGQIKIATTNSIDGYKVSQYLGLVNANVVIGANIISDWLAAFTDVFGGYSNTYQNKLDDIYDKALIELKNKAEEINADAVLGVSLDFSEIAGKGKAMFMLSAYGTAVKLIPEY